MTAEIKAHQIRSGIPAADQGLVDHGIVFPAAHSRGTVATVNGAGQNVVLLWLADHRGGYGLLMINIETCETREFPMPFPPEQDYPYASILSLKNKFYTHFNSRFVEFDPEKAEFTFIRETAPGAAMSMTEDDQGRIWSATYPNSGVARYDPAKREFRDYGHVYKQNWLQYPRSIAVDSAGWLYFGIGTTRSQIISLDPDTGNALPMLGEGERRRGAAFVYRDINGKVYGNPHKNSKTGWREYFKGEEQNTGHLGKRRQKNVVAGDQSLFYEKFPDGSRLLSCDPVKRVLIVEDKFHGKQSAVHFDYTVEGAGVVALTKAPDGSVCGATGFPSYFFSYNTKNSNWIRRPCYGQWNVLASQDTSLFVGGYMQGFLLEWDTTRPWIPTDPEKPETNPGFLFECAPGINRPHSILSCPTHKTIVLAGTPAYGHTGGGLLFWERAGNKGVFIEHKEIIPYHSTNCMAGPIGHVVIGGTTTRPGTGGEQKAKQAELYFINIKTKKVEWHEPVLPGIQEFSDILLCTDGLVYGLAGSLPFNPKRMSEPKIFFVFDPAKRKIIHAEDTEPTFGPVHLQQGHRKILAGPDGRIFVIFMNKIAETTKNQLSLKLTAELDVNIEIGGAIIDNRIYFSDGQKLYSHTTY